MKKFPKWKLFSNMITQAITASRPTDHKTVEILSNQTRIFEKIVLKIQQIFSSGFQTRTQSTSVFLNTISNNTGTTESKSPTKVIGISLPTISALKPGITKPLQIQSKPFDTVLVFLVIQLQLKNLPLRITLLL